MIGTQFDVPSMARTEKSKKALNITNIVNSKPFNPPTVNHVSKLGSLLLPARIIRLNLIIQYQEPVNAFNEYLLKSINISIE